MAITNTGTARTTSNSNLVGTTGLNIEMPDNVIENSWLLMVSHRNDNIADFTTPSGWTRLTAIDGTESGGEDRQTFVGWRFAPAAPPTHYLLVHTDTGAEQWSGTITAYDGVDQTTPVDVTPVTADHYQAFVNKAATNVDAYEDITTVTDGAWVIIFDAITHNDITGSVTLSGWNIRKTMVGTGHNLRQLILFDKEIATAGAVTPGTSSYTSDNTVAESQHCTLAIRPAGVGSLLPLRRPLRAMIGR